MIPALLERAAEAERNRRLPHETIAEIQNAGLFRVIQPRRWGGQELGMDVLCNIEIALGEGDMSTAWVFGNVAGLAGHLALFDDRAARDVWGGDTSTLICCSMMRAGRATRVADGFRLSGRWKYLSGCDYCDWAVLGGDVSGEDAELEGARAFLVPSSEMKLVDTWHVVGLRATGSRDAVVEEVYVPDYRTHRLTDYFHCRGPGQAVNTAPLYRLPFGHLFARGPSTSAIGALRGMLKAFSAYAVRRTTVTGSATAEDPEAQLICAETTAALDEMEVVLHRNFQRLTAYAEQNKLPPHQERMRFKFQAAAVAERCSRLAARIFKAAGAAALFDELPFGRILADINAGRQHIANQFEVHGRNWGRSMLGLESRSDFFM
jgi:3-hydroxy-9,10-secoandrosta-1,3,5(10)-triene-9,17-dione monooxygenase